MPRKKLTEEERRASRKATSRRYYLKRKEYYSSPEYAEKRKKWRLRSLEKHISRCREYKKKNRETLLKKERDYRKNNPSEYAKKRRVWRIENISAYKNAVKNWKSKNRQYIYEYSVNKRAELRRLTHPDLNKKSVSAICGYAKIISKKTGIDHEVDHIIPLCEGGWHHHDNLQAIPRDMNGAFGKWKNPFWIAPMGYKDWRDVPCELWPAHLAPKYLALIEQNKGVSIRWDTAA